MRKKLLSLLLALAMVLGLFPLTDFAYAEGSSNRAIQLGTSAIESPVKHTVSEGSYYTPSSYIYFGYYQGAGIKWRVLDANKDNNGTANRMFLMSEEEKESMQFKSDNTSDTYQGSDAQTWCKSFAENRGYFSENEYNTMVGVAKSEASNNLYIGSKEEYSGLSWGTSELKTTDKMFFMSVKELSDYVANYDSAADLRTGNWWLRTPLTVLTNYNAGAVLNDSYYTGVNAIGVYSNVPARPAFNLDKSQVLFASAAKDGKPTSAVGSSLTSIGYYNGNEWKLTLKDTNRALNVTEEEATGVAGGSISLHFSGATYTQESTNEYISAMLVNGDDEVIYYGRVKKLTSEAGEVSITIPDVDAGDYTLKLFNEQYNGNYRTDYASDFKDVSLTVTTPKEAKIGDVSYDKLEEALTAASSNNTADTIEIITDSVTAVDSETLKAGDSIKKVYTSQWHDQTYTYTYQFKATTDATLSVNSEDGYICFGFTGGEVNIVSGEALFSNGAVATGKTGKRITVTDGSAWVEAGDEDDETDYVDVSPGGKVKIGDAVYENADTSSVGGTSMRIDVTATGNTLTDGSVNLDKNGEIYLDVYEEEAEKNISTLIKNTGDEAIIVTANNSSYGWDNTVTVPAGGKVKIGSKEYEVGEAAATFIVYDEDNVTLAGGEVKLDKTEQILVGEANVPVINQGDKTINVTANADGTGKAVIPQGGKAKINNKEISVSEGSASVGIGTDGALTVTINPGKVKIGDMTYTGDVLLNIDSNGNVTQGKGNVIIDEKVLEDSNFTYELLSGQSATIGKYTYTAPATGSKGDVTIKSRGANKNPAVVLKNANDTVDISLTDEADTKTTYTAVNANTTFAMSANDSDTTNIDLLSNGDTTANSRIKVTSGVTVKPENSSAVTSTADDTVICLDGSLFGVLESGEAKTDGTMFAVINDTIRTFSAPEGNTLSYTVNTDDNILTVPGSLTVTDCTGNKTGAKFTNGTFAFGTDSNGITVNVSDGASVIGKNYNDESSTITGFGGNTLVSIYDEYGSICLIDGKGQSDGIMDVEKDEYTYTFASEGNKYIVDTNGTLILDEAGAVTLEDEITFDGKTGDIFTLGTSNDKFTAIVPAEAAVIGSGRTVKGVAKTEGGKDTKVEINMETGELTLLEGAAIITIANEGDEFTMSGQTYTTALANTTFSVDSEGNGKLISGGIELNDDESIIGIKGKLITNPLDSSEDKLLVTVEDGNDAITIPAKDGKVKIADTEYVAAADNTKIVVDDNGNKLISGGVELNDDESIIGVDGKPIVNPANSGSDKLIITVDDGKNIVEVPANGQVEIGGVLYIAGSNGVTLVVDFDGKVSVTAGSLKIDEKNDKDNNGSGGDADKSSNNLSDADGSDSTSKTGDDSNVSLWIALLLISCGTFVGTTAINRKKKYNKN